MSTPDAFAVRQACLQRAIVAPGDAALRAQAVQFLHTSANLGGDARLAIYQRSYRARLLEAFHAMFPALLHAIGADALDTFALDFLSRHRPKHASVGRIADGFAAYLDATRPPQSADAAAGWEDFVTDLTRLEHALLEISDARGLEGEPPPKRDVRALSDDDLLRARPVPAPCLRLLACRFPVHRYWHAVRAGETPAQPDPAPCRLALTRVEYRLSTRELAPVQWELLARCDGGTSVRAQLDAVAALGLRPTADLALARIWLGNFITQGLLRSC